MNRIRRNVLKALGAMFAAPALAGLPKIAPADVLTIDKLRDAVELLKRNAVQPVDGAYFVHVNDYTRDLIEPAGEWKDLTRDMLSRGEIGRYESVRFITPEKWTCQ